MERKSKDYRDGGDADGHHMEKHEEYKMIG
jgi:hypothetical protein